MDDLKEYADRLKFEIMAADFLTTEDREMVFDLIIALLTVGVAIGALLGETSRQQHDRELFPEYINFMTESEHNNELLFREVIRLQTEKGADHEKE